MASRTHLRVQSKAMSVLSRRSFVCANALLGPAFVRRRYALLGQSSERTYSSRAIQLTQESVVVDLLNQFRFPHSTETPVKRELWLKDPRTFSAEDLDVYHKSGISIFALGHGAGDYAQAIRYLARWNGFLAGRSDVLRRITHAEHFELSRREKKVGVILSFQDSTHFRTPQDVDEFYSLGQRISQLTYNYNNRIGSGFLENKDGGLSVFGHSILQRMEQTGMAVDLSHCGDQTTLDALDAATRPILFTHATCRGLVPGHLRAKTDEMIRKMAKSGGLIGVNFIRFLVSPQEPVGVGSVLDHFDYVKKVVGSQFLAIGSDLDVLGFGLPMKVSATSQHSSTPQLDLDPQPNFERYRVHVAKPNLVTVDGLDHPRRVFDLVEGLIERGYSDEDIRLVLGGNAVRVLGRIWK